MTVSNFKCLTCKSMEVCKVFAILKKFDEEYARNPLPVDITMDDCELYTPDEQAENDKKKSDEAEDVDI